MQSALHVVGRAGDDSDLRARLRLTLAILVAKHFENDPSDIVDIVTNEEFYKKGFVGAKGNNGEVIWACSYVGWERCTSKWAKDKGYHCVICLRMVAGRLEAGNTSNNFEGEAHTVQFYY